MSQDFETFYAMAQKVVDAMVDEYHVPMILDQATISNTNKHGHPPHAASCLQVFYTCNATSGYKWYQMVTFSKGIILKTRQVAGRLG